MCNKWFNNESLQLSRRYTDLQCAKQQIPLATLFTALNDKRCV